MGQIYGAGNSLNNKVANFLQNSTSPSPLAKALPQPLVVSVLRLSFALHWNRGPVGVFWSKVAGEE
jgi:hypothetical protein